MMSKAWNFYRRVVDAVYAPFFFGAFAFEAVRGASSTGVESVAHFGFAFALLALMFAFYAGDRIGELKREVLALRSDREPK